MKATIKGIIVEGTVEEVYKFFNLYEEDTKYKPLYARGGYTGTGLDPVGYVHQPMFTTIPRPPANPTHIIGCVGDLRGCEACDLKRGKK